MRSSPPLPEPGVPAGRRIPLTRSLLTSVGVKLPPGVWGILSGGVICLTISIRGCVGADGESENMDKDWDEKSCGSAEKSARARIQCCCVVDSPAGLTKFTTFLFDLLNGVDTKGSGDSGMLDAPGAASANMYAVVGVVVTRKQWW